MSQLVRTSCAFAPQAKAAKEQVEDEVQEEDEEDAEHAETATEQPKIDDKPVVSPLTAHFNADAKTPDCLHYKTLAACTNQRLSSCLQYTSQDRILVQLPSIRYNRYTWQ